MNRTTDVMTLGRAAAPSDTRVSALTSHLFVVAQLLAATLVVYIYGIEGPAFLRVFALASAGFAINLALPMRYRMPFFVLLSLAGFLVVFGWADAAWLFGSGLVLIGLCHLPIRFGARVMAVLVTAALLAASRAGFVAAPWSGAVWPILGSMFMFRLVQYLMAIRSGHVAKGGWTTLAYFFMLPNLVFPLYPVVDFQSFRKNYYDRPETGIYEQGLLWISRGLVHLVLYRLVYHGLLNDPSDVVALGDLVQFMLTTFLLYLRVSGQFHLIVGMLHLFGFRLPETHKLYYLAHSFTELWRRINIYWTDFMMKAVFYPTYFKVKKYGASTGLVLSTAAVFLTTWILHSYQWFWLRGGFPITLQDTLFWGALGALVVAGALRESKVVRKPKPRDGRWDLRLGLKAAGTFGFFCLLWSLWSTQSVSQWVWMLGAAANPDVKGFVLLAVTFSTLVILGGYDWEATRSGAFSGLKPAARTSIALAVLLIAAQPSVRGWAPKPAADLLASLHETGLNARDADLQHRGYYEQLDVRAQLAAPGNEAVLDRRENWEDLSQIGVLRSRRDLLLRDLHPSRQALWNTHTFSTNRWGMRDKEYDQQKATDTLRIALLGPSHVMGNGVSDGETFEALVEDRLNREFTLDGYRRVEILNFGVDGYALTQQVAMLEDRVLAFSPDIVIATHYQRNRLMTEGYLVKIASGDIHVPHEELHALLSMGGLANIDRGNVPVPFAAGRHLARWAGIAPRMPSEETSARARWIADDVLAWSFRRFAEVSRANGIVPAVLALNAVIDDVPAEIPNLDVMRAAQLPILDLFDIFPEAMRPALRVAPWDDHPNAEGHRLIAERLYEQLGPFLKKFVAERQSHIARNAIRRRS